MRGRGQPWGQPFWPGQAAVLGCCGPHAARVLRCMRLCRSPVPTRSASRMQPTSPGLAWRCSSTACPSCGARGSRQGHVCLVLGSTAAGGHQKPEHCSCSWTGPPLERRRTSAHCATAGCSRAAAHAAAAVPHLRADAGHARQPDAGRKDEPGAVAGPDAVGQQERDCEEGGADEQQRGLLQVLARRQAAAGVAVEAGMDEQRPAGGGGGAGDGGRWYGHAKYPQRGASATHHDEQRQEQHPHLPPSRFCSHDDRCFDFARQAQARRHTRLLVSGRLRRRRRQRGCGTRRRRLPKLRARRVPRLRPICALHGASGSGGSAGVACERPTGSAQGSGSLHPR